MLQFLAAASGQDGDGQRASRGRPAGFPGGPAAASKAIVRAVVLHQGMPHGKDVETPLGEKLGFKGQDGAQAVDLAPEAADSPGAPGPDLRRDEPENRNAQLPGLGGQPPLKPGKSMGTTRSTRCSSRCCQIRRPGPQQGRQGADDFGKTHDGQFVGIGDHLGPGAAPWPARRGPKSANPGRKARRAAVKAAP